MSNDTIKMDSNIILTDKTGQVIKVKTPESEVYIEELGFLSKKVNASEVSNKVGCDLCNNIHIGYTVKNHPFIYYDNEKFTLSSEYQGHGGTKYLEGTKYCPYCGCDLYKKSMD